MSDATVINWLSSHCSYSREGDRWHCCCFDGDCFEFYLRSTGAGKLQPNRVRGDRYSFRVLLNDLKRELGMATTSFDRWRPTDTVDVDLAVANEHDVQVALRQLIRSGSIPPKETLLARTSDFVCIDTIVLCAIALHCSTPHMIECCEKIYRSSMFKEEFYYRSVVDFLSK